MLCCAVLCRVVSYGFSTLTKGKGDLDGNGSWLREEETEGREVRVIWSGEELTGTLGKTTRQGEGGAKARDTRDETKMALKEGIH